MDLFIAAVLVLTTTDYVAGDSKADYGTGRVNGDQYGVPHHLGTEGTTTVTRVSGDRYGVPHHLGTGGTTTVTRVSGDRYGVPHHLGTEGTTTVTRVSGDRYGVPHHLGTGGTATVTRVSGDRYGVPHHLGTGGTTTVTRVSDVRYGDPYYFGTGRQLGTTSPRFDGDQYEDPRYFGTTNTFGNFFLRGTNGFVSDHYGNSADRGDNYFDTNRFGYLGLPSTSRYGSSLYGNTRHGGNIGYNTNQFGYPGGLFGDNRFGTSGYFGPSRFYNGLYDSAYQFGTYPFGRNSYGANSNIASTRFRTNQFGSGYYGDNNFNRFGRTRIGSTGPFYGRDASVSDFISHRSDHDGSGYYDFGYETSNGITRHERAEPNGLGSLAVTGSYSYTSPEGVPVKVNYIADENGFRVDSPNVPPVPEHSKRQIVSAEQARHSGLVDQSGEYLPSHHSTELNQNSNFGRGSERFAGLRNQHNLGRFGGRFNRDVNGLNLGRQLAAGNLLRTPLLTPPLFANNFIAPQQILSRRNLEIDNSNDFTNFPRRDSSIFFNRNTRDDPRFDLRDFRNPITAFPQNFPGTIFQTPSFAGNVRRFNPDAEAFINPSDLRFDRRVARLGEQVSSAFDSPSFQPLTASRFGFPQGRHRRLRNFDFVDDLNVRHTDLALASELKTGIGGHTASYIYKS